MIKEFAITPILTNNAHGSLLTSHIEWSGKMPLRRYIAFATGYTLIFLCLPLSAFAGKVELARARQAAQNWLQNSARDKRLVGNNIYRITGQEPVVVNKKTVGYNFILSPRGHIIVPSRDELPVVKLYSFTSTLRMDQETDVAKWISEELFGVEEVLDKHAAEMAGVNHADTHNGRLWARFGKDSALFSRESAALSAQQSEALSFGPLLSTTWNQSDPYNLNTPLWYNGQKTYTGCVATAAAQIMKFWNYPATGQNSTSYTWNNGSTNVTLSANFSTSTYDWGNMTNSYGGASTTAQRQAVAKLMSDVGIAFNMGYGVSGSAADTMAGTTVYPDYFKYKDTIHAVYRTSYVSDSAWMQVFNNEVQNGRPSQFRISGPPGGHSVVVDGYQDSPSEQIHLNMGWSGSYDGWYVSNNIVAGSYVFNNVDYQAAVIGIEPAVGASQCNPPASITVPSASSGTYTVSWGASTTTGVTYVLEESESPDFSIVSTAYSGSALSAGITKASDGIFYYRVKAIRSGYTDSSYATSATGCVVDVPGVITVNSSDVPKAIGDNGTITSTLTLPSGLCDFVTDVNVSLNITHSYVSDLTVSVTRNGSGKSAQLFGRSCDDNAYANLIATFDDEAPTAVQCPPNGAYLPATPLNVLDGINAAGTWTLSVTDNATEDTGTLNSWGITLACASVSRQLSLAINGNGSVNSSPAGIACTTGNNGSCSAHFADGAPVTLTATGVSSPTLLSHFGNWSGACDSTIGPACSVAMYGNRNISSTFITNQPVYLSGGSHYGSLQTAYDVDGIIIESQAVALPALDFTLDKGKTVTLKGGYNSTYLSNSGGNTIMDGILTLGTGSLTVENLIIK
jgi:subtilisin-like proprotein convertase family protein